MKTTWLIECTDDLPRAYIAIGGGLTHQPLKANRYGSKFEAEKALKEFKLGPAWQAVARDLPEKP
jgi:hypothetical protein